MMDDFERDLATALKSAVPAPPAEIDPADLTRGPRRPARPLAAPLVTALLVAAAVVTVVALAHSGAPRPAASPPQTVASGSHEPYQPLAVKIELDRTTVRAGEPINGEVTVTNATAHPLEIADCNGEWIQVGLTNATVSYNPAWSTCLSIPGTTLPVGTTRIPIIVRTTYNSCTQQTGSATADMPACLHHIGGSIMPPLPPGSYTTRAVMLDPKGVRLPTPEPIQVTLTP